VLLCPTNESKQNLHHIMSQNSKAYVVGNTVLDNLLNVVPSISNTILITMHRRENLCIMDKWFKSINELAASNPQLEFVFPMHLNPEIQKHKGILKNVKIMNPLPYEDMKNYLSKCGLVITDSGGLQEESSFLKKKCIVCRATTERIEGEYIFSWLCQSPEMLSDVFNSIKMELVNSRCPYGDGKSSEKILNILERL
jgi:UDP-N-acetylglucosamine 2-epimerase (non-hydrolysing)